MKKLLKFFNDLVNEYVDCFYPEHYGLAPRPPYYTQRKRSDVQYSDQIKEICFWEIVKTCTLVEDKKDSLVVYPFSWEIEIKDQPYQYIKSHKIFLTEEDASKDLSKYLKTVIRYS